MEIKLTISLGHMRPNIELTLTDPADPAVIGPSLSGLIEDAIAALLRSESRPEAPEPKRPPSTGRVTLEDSEPASGRVANGSLRGDYNF